MRFLRRLAVLAVIGAAATLVPAASAAASTTDADHTLIQGSGSAWAANAVNQWVSDVQSEDGMQVVYNPDGDAAGRQDFANRVSDFAVTDVPYQGTDPKTGVPDASQGREYGVVPIAAGGLSFPYHLTVHGQQYRDLRLSGRTLAQIFTGRLTNWDAPEITADNNGVRLPSTPIVPVVQSEASGDSYNLTTYLADQFPGIWQAFSGSRKPSEYYPLPSDGVAENGSDGAMNYVSSAAANGAITAVEYAYALDQNYPVAKVRNAAGFYNLPTQYNVAIALRTATIDENPADSTYLWADLGPVFNSIDRRAYPLSFYSSMLIPTASDDSKMTTPKRQTILDFAYYDICKGQQETGPIGYAPLPLNLVEAGLTQLDRLGAADPDVDLTDRDVSHCANPTFIGSDPSRDHLGSIAVEPPACDRGGEGPCDINTVVRLASSTTQARVGHRVVLRGRLVDTAATGNPPHAEVRLQRRLRGQSWQTVVTRKTSLTGAIRFRRTLRATSRYRLVDIEAGSGRPISPAIRVAVVREGNTS